MADSHFATFLRRAMALLSRECPPAFRELCKSLEASTIRLQVDGVAISPDFGADGFALLPPHPDPEVDLVSDRDAILSVIDGGLTLEEAAWSERIVLFGSLGALARFHDAFVLCVNGAVRCPSFPELLEQYRQAGLRAAGDL